MDALLDGLAELPFAVLHLAVFGLAFAETALFLDLLVPGEVGLVLAGAAVDRAGSPVGTVIAAGVVGATAGDCCSFALGQAVGSERWRRPAWLLDRARRAAAGGTSFFDRWGGAAVFLGRFVGALRAAVPFAAGIGGMRFGRFLAWNLAASIVWVSVVVLLGAHAGPSIADALDRIGGWVSVVAVGFVVVALLVRRLLRHRRGDDDVEVAARSSAR